MENHKSTGTNTHRRTIRRSSVYAATIVAMLAMVGGFALAAWGFNGTISSGQNTEQATVGNTFWSGSTPALSAVFLGATQACASTYTFAAAGGTIDACVADSTGTPATSSATISAGDFVEEFKFSGLSVGTSICGGTTCTDSFAVTVIDNAGGGTATFSSVVVTAAASGTVTDNLNIWIDFGASAPSSITGLDVVAVGQ